MPNPFAEALAKLTGRGLILADLSSGEWAGVPQALRERAFFIARLNNARIAQTLYEGVKSMLNPGQERRPDRVTPDNPEGYVTTGKDLATLRAEGKALLRSIGYDPGDKAGTIQDLSSDARLELIYKTNVESAQGFGAFLQGQAPGAIDAFPAQELFRLEDRKDERPWPTRWMQAGGQIFGGRMIALKNDPIWENLGDQNRYPDALGNPYPPFAFNSGMWVRDIPRSEAIELGLMTAEDVVQPMAAVERYNERLEASVKGLRPELLESLKKTFGDQIEIVGDTVRWAGR